MCAHHIEKRPTTLTPKIVLDALRASTKRTPATSGKGLAKFTKDITRTAVAAKEMRGKNVNERVC